MVVKDRSSTESGLRELRASLKTFRLYERNLELSVGIARERGATWEQIGEVFGITKQAAQQRFGDS